MDFPLSSTDLPKLHGKSPVENGSGLDGGFVFHIGINYSQFQTVKDINNNNNNNI
jgi:hypothetical protein